MTDFPLPTERSIAWIDELTRIGGLAVQKALEENRRRGIPNVFEIDGRILYETPSGELSSIDPYPNSRVSGD